MKHIELKKSSAGVTLAFAIVLLAAGVLLLVLNPVISVTLAIIAEVVLIVITGIIEVTDSFKNKRKKEAVTRIIIYAALAVFVGVFSMLFLTILIIFYAVIALLLFVIRVLVCIHLARNGGKHIIRNAVAGILCLAFGVIVFMLPPEETIIFLIIVVGIFFILYSFNYFLDFFAVVRKTDMDDRRTKRRIRFSLPNLFTAGLVNDIIDDCNKLIKENPDDGTFVFSAEKYDPSQINFEIMVHISKTPLGSMGHIDVCVEDTIYSYGDYDEKTKILGGLVGGGVFFKVPKKPYIYNCIKNSNKYLIGYGCVLSDSQIKAVKERITEMIGQSAELALEAALAQGRREEDYLLVLLRMGGQVFLVEQGEYKRYFGLGTNCVCLANTIMGKAGFEDLSQGSLKTPGAYLNLLEGMLYRSNTRVVQRTAYLKAEDEQADNA